MNDILFDIVTREIVFLGNNPGNDFELTENPSVQNGGIILYSKGANPLSPMVGVGILNVVNGSQTQMTFEMNRWQSQVNNDGATLAAWTAKPVPGDIEIHTKQSYL